MNPAEELADPTFDLLADEYYNARLHPTCSNFRTASLHLIRGWKNKLLGNVCEVGAGKSVVAEIASNENRWPASLIITDPSERMLEHSRHWERRDVHFLVAPSQMLPIRDHSLDTLVASLGDPYNVPAFWREARRVVRRNGWIIFTAPSAEWKVAFREVLERSPPDQADFVMSDGRRVSIQSFVYPEPDQTRIIEDCDLSVLEVRHATLRELAGEVISQKLLVQSPSAPVVTAFLVQPDGF